jgi:hypothetical protein
MDFLTKNKFIVKQKRRKKFATNQGHLNKYQKGLTLKEQI